MSDEEKKVNIEQDGKATPSDETVEQTEKIQQADTAAQTTSEPSDAPAAELKEQAEGTAEGQGAVQAAEEAEKAAPATAEEGAPPKADRAEAKRSADSATTDAAGPAPGDADKEAKAKAAAEARAARAAARAKKAEGEEAKPKEPSPNQPRLDRLVQLIKENVSADAVEEAYINERDRHLPCVIIKGERLIETLKLMKSHEELKLGYLRNVSGIDQETHMEVAYHLVSLSTKHTYYVKVKTDREQPSVPSVTPLYETANWNEREIYDLLGIDFPGHPDLRRIMMSDDWVGHPLRKDYVPIDPEV